MDGWMPGQTDRHLVTLILYWIHTSQVARETPLKVDLAISLLL